MLSRLKLVPTLITIPSLIILVWLGVWQLQRMDW
ncbi:MAG TPA: SURF1 family protein, partial [Rhodospirillaceae bacterium]|nr:SURF1 family protein [Rhodospirillaceae bacterium]